MDRPRICVVITADNTKEALNRIAQTAQRGPDIIEVRLDYLKLPLDPVKLRASTDIPLIATNRRKDQGGLTKMEEPDRVAAILEAVDAGFEYADLELNTPGLNELGSRVKDLGGKLIVSHHDFQTTPQMKELKEKLKSTLEFGADISKIIGKARTLGDNLIYMRLIRERRDTELVSFGMGPDGILSRVLSPLLGGAFTYASTHRGGESAPGQLTLAEMKEIYQLMEV